MADNDINIRIESVNREAGSSGGVPVGGGSVVGGSAGPSSGVSQPTPSDIQGRSGSVGKRTKTTGATVADIREAFGEGQQESLTEQALKSFGLTRGLGSAIEKYRNAQNKQAFSEYKKEYRAWEKSRADWFEQQNAAPDVPQPAMPPTFAPGGQVFVASEAQPAPGSVPPLPGSSGSTPPPVVPGGGSATSNAGIGPNGLPIPPGGSGGHATPPPPPTPPSGPGSPGGRPVLPNMSGASGAALAGLGGAVAGAAIVTGIEGIKAIAGKVAEGVERLADEFRNATKEVAPFSAPVLESIVESNLQRLIDIEFRAFESGREIADYNTAMYQLQSETHRAMTEFMDLTGPLLVEGIQTATLWMRGVKGTIDRIDEVATIWGIYLPFLRKLYDLGTEWNDQQKAMELEGRMKALAGLLSPKGIDPIDEGDPREGKMPMFPMGFPGAPPPL